ncbi:MAG: nickel-dependent hydrogenase large subunit [Verrucomicrobia bacterium]|nr:nickel-dependent hydrogenase large subunit [Verrucomicrobiota bacterium]
MNKTLTLSPITRIEGHLAVKVEVEDNRVARAFVSGEMFRGFEQILRGRDPQDAQHITQRICGVCSVEHGVASVLAQEMAFGAEPPANGRLVRNLIQAANFIMSHIAHFYLLSAVDFVDVEAVSGYQGKDQGLRELQAWVKSQLASKLVSPIAPLLPRYAAKYLQDPDANFTALRHYLDAFEFRSLATKMGAVFAGKLPHAATLVAGGVTERVTALKITQYKSFLAQLQSFIEQAYLPDVVAVARSFPEYFSVGQGCGNFLCYGVFPESGDNQAKVFPAGVLIGEKLGQLAPDAVTEDVAQSWFSSATGLRPMDGETTPAPTKGGAYSWLKAPRYNGQVMEVGPLARMLVSYHDGRNPALKTAVDGLLKALDKPFKDLVSAMGRHAARALECKLIAERCGEWLNQLAPDSPTCRECTVPESARGFGLTEAARGALGHWIEIRGRKIRNYQCVVPTTWNCSPRDDRGIPGAVEQALVGLPITDAENPIEVARIVRSFDPCLACAVH